MPDKSLTVAHIASGDLWAGAEVQLFMLARAQRQHGLQVNAILLNPGVLTDKLAAEGVTVYVLPEAELTTAAIFWRMLRLIRLMAPDIVHTHRSKENILGGLSAWINHIPSVRTQHGAPESKCAWWAVHRILLRTMDRWIGKHIQQKVIAVTQDLAAKLRDDFPPTQLTVIENGIDSSAFSKLSPDRSYLPEFYDAKRRVGIVGRLVPVKRVDIFIEACAKLMQIQELQDVDFFVIGDGPMRIRLEEQAVHLRSRLHFLGNIDTVHPYIEGLDVLVICSDHEGLPMTLLEAMALKVPVVGHMVGGIAMLMNDGRNGWTVSNQDPASYGEAIHKALAAGKNGEKVDRAARNVNENFSSHASAKKYLSVYLDAAGHKTDRRSAIESTTDKIVK